MSIFKIIKVEQYATISNDLLNDPSISLRAKGLLCFLISKPTTWNLNVNHLYKVCKEGKDAIYATINELIDTGYIVRVRLKDGQGKHIGVDYHVYECPQRAFQDVENPNGDKPDNSNTEPLVNTEGSKGPGKPANAKGEEITPVQRKIKFVESILHWVAENDNKYPKLMYMEFMKYWMEQSTKLKKVKLRFEEQRFFDIGRRLSTWFQKCNDKTLTDYWEQDKKLAPLNELCRSLFPKNPPTNPS